MVQEHTADYSGPQAHYLKKYADDDICYLEGPMSRHSLLRLWYWGCNNSDEDSLYPETGPSG